ncbi:hypothetical protein ACFL3T_02560 [Patescibacteria group bacterium]
MELITKHKYWRLLEMVPGLIAWSALLLPIVIAIYYPIAIALLAIVYALIWLFRSIRLSINLYRGYRRTQNAMKVNWNYLLDLVEHPEKIDQAVSEVDFKKPLLQPMRILNLELKNLKNRYIWMKKHEQYLKPSEIYHAILVVTFKESFELVRESVKSYTESFYPHEKLILVLGGEEGDQENFKKISNKLIEEFGHKFFKVITTVHPKGIPGEIPGKSANATFAAKELKKYVDSQDIDYNNVILSNFDADTVVHPAYFSELTFKYLMTKNRTQKVYQPTHMFHNNIWDVPIMIRMVALSCTFWRMAEALDKNKYKSFSSRSMGFRTVLDTNYWDPSIIPEDSRQFWTAFMKYNGKHTVSWIYTPVYMDAVLSDTYVETFKSQYIQLRRWAWGVVDFPFMALNISRHPKIKFGEKVKRIFIFLENAFFWATGPIIIMTAGFWPSLMNAEFRGSVLAYNLPQITSQILTIAAVGIIMCGIISVIVVPKREKKSLWGRFLLLIQWLLVPVTSIFLSAIPALDAQTRLMFGKHLEYKVTEKARKK